MWNSRYKEYKRSETGPYEIIKAINENDYTHYIQIVEKDFELDDDEEDNDDDEVDCEEVFMKYDSIKVLKIWSEGVLYKIKSPNAKILFKKYAKHEKEYDNEKFSEFLFANIGNTKRKTFKVWIDASFSQGVFDGNYSVCDFRDAVVGGFIREYWRRYGHNAEDELE